MGGYERERPPERAIIERFKGRITTLLSHIAMLSPSGSSGSGAGSEIDKE